MGNILAKVRAEIERRYDKITTLPIGKDEHWEAIMGAKAATLHSLLSFIDSMQEEPKKCMYTKDYYTDEDRKALCDGCEEECRFNKKEESINNGLDLGCGVIWKDEEPTNNLGLSNEEYGKVIDECIYGKEPELVDVDELPKEEPVSEDLEEAAIQFATDTETGKVDVVKQSSFFWGAIYHKHQMMAKAVDATVHIDAGGYPYIPQMELYDYDKDIPFAKEGDKYKVILIKED